MKTHRLTTHLSAADALAVIDLLDQLRDVLINAYGDDIEQLLKEACTTAPPDQKPHNEQLILFDQDPF